MYSKKAGGKVPVFCVFDNGHGMTYAQMMKMVLFGHDQPNEHHQDQIGRFGIGFKVNTCVKIYCLMSHFYTFFISRSSL
jgi:hypothetical protein